MFLKLTYHDNGKTLYVNSDHIVTMGSHNEVTSRIGLIGDNEAFEVSESLDQIEAMLNQPSSPYVWLGDPDKFMEEWRRSVALGRRLDATGVRGSLEPSQTKTMNYGAAPVPTDFEVDPEEARIKLSLTSYVVRSAHTLALTQARCLEETIVKAGDCPMYHTAIRHLNSVIDELTEVTKIIDGISNRG